MTTPTTRKAKSSGTAQASRTSSAAAKSASTKARTAAKTSASRTTTPKTTAAKKTSAGTAEATGGGRTVSFTLPSFGRIAKGAMNTALLPVAVARQVLPAKGGLPLYLGLGALGAADVLDWPVAVGIGLGYAVLRRTGRLGGPPPAQV